MAVATVVIFASVVLRFLASVPYVQDVAIRLSMTWAQELCIFLFVWMAKFGAAYGVRGGAGEPRRAGERCGAVEPGTPDAERFLRVVRDGARAARQPRGRHTHAAR